MAVCIQRMSGGLAIDRVNAKRRAHFWRLVFLCAVAFGALAGCEAPYSLEAIEAEAGKTFRRSDDIKALATHGDLVVAVGGQGVVVRSGDRGESWARTELAGKPALIDVASCPDGSFVALDFDRAVFVARAGDGSEWARRALPGRDIGLDLTCDAANRVWVVGEFSTIWRSDDRGQTWSTQSFDRDAIFTAIQFVDHEFGFVAGEFGSFLVTETAGEEWTWQPPVDAEEEFYPQSAVFRSRDQGWLVGLGGTVLHTDDRGESWRREASPVAGPLFGLALHGQEPVAVGGLGAVMKRGSSWELVRLEPAVFTSLGAVASTDASHVIVAGDGGECRRVPLEADTTP